MLSASATATNQNIWIEEMNKVVGDYKGINVVSTVYGDDLSDKSYREAQGLMSSHSDLKAIIAPTSVGIVAAAQEVGLSVPLVVRLEGTNVEQGRKILDDSDVKLQTATTMADAAEKIAAAVKG